MFLKPYTHKATNTLKNSEKKQLLQRLKVEYPSVSDEKLKDLVPMKGVVSCHRVVLHSGAQASVLAADGVPLLLDMDTGLMPALAALWRVPDLLPSLIIHAAVLPKVGGGAPLYLPGVVMPAHGVGFPMFGAGAALAVRTDDNAAAAIVGRAAMASADMLLRTGGVCLEPIQVYRDQLCKDVKFTKVDRPMLGISFYGSDIAALGDIDSSMAQLNLKESTKAEEWPALGDPRPVATPVASDTNTPAVTVPQHPYNTCLTAGDGGVTLDTVPDDDAAPVPEDMDGMLRWSLLSFLKHCADVALPLKTNLLYKNHMIPLCPPGKTLDVKKSSYKKMSKFLEAMQQEGLLEVQQVERGVWALTACSRRHPAVREHRAPPPAPAPAPAPAASDAYAPPQVRELYCITAAVAELFPEHKKGAALSGGEVRTAVTQYVRSHSLQQADQRDLLMADLLLAKILSKSEQELVRWDEVCRGVTSRMTAATELRFEDGSQKLLKQRLEPIQMQVAMRSGNKKVTLVSNLESYGFVLSSLSRACQLAVGAACAVTRSPGAKHDQLMLQGDQTHFVAKLLIEKYGLPKKFVDGADKALNKKK